MEGSGEGVFGWLLIEDAIEYRHGKIDQNPISWRMVSFDGPGRPRERVYIDKSDCVAFMDLSREAREVLNVGLPA